MVAGDTTWVLVANDGDHDAVAAAVTVTCVNHTHVEYNEGIEEYNANLSVPTGPGTFGGGKKPKPKLPESCSFVQDQQVPVPALEKGEVHPLMQISTVPQDAESGWGGPWGSSNPSFDVIDYTITFEGPGGDRLVLTTKPKLNLPLNLKMGKP